MASQVEEVVEGPNLTGALGEENFLKGRTARRRRRADVISRRTGVHLDVAVAARNVAGARRFGRFSRLMSWATAGFPR